MQVALAISLSESEFENTKQLRLLKQRQIELQEQLENDLKGHLFDYDGDYYERFFDNEEDKYVKPQQTLLPESEYFEFKELDTLVPSWELIGSEIQSFRKKNSLSCIQRRKQRSLRFVRITHQLMRTAEQELADRRGLTLEQQREMTKAQEVIRDPLNPFTQDFMDAMSFRHGTPNTTTKSEATTTKSTTPTPAQNQGHLTRKQEAQMKKSIRLAESSRKRTVRKAQRNARIAKKAAEEIQPWNSESDRSSNVVLPVHSPLDTFRYRFYLEHRDAIVNCFESSTQVNSIELAPTNHAIFSRFVCKDLSKVHLTFHGTREKNQAPICEKGFIIPGQEGVGVANGSAHGVGIYTSRTADYSVSYASDCKSMFVCAVYDDTSSSTESCHYRHVGEKKHLTSKNGSSQSVKCVNNIVVLFNKSYVVPLFKITYGPKDQSETPAGKQFPPMSMEATLYKKARILARRIMGKSVTTRSKITVRTAQQLLPYF